MQGVVCECIGTDSFVLKPDPRSERSRSLKCAKINNGTLIPSNRVQYVFKVHDQYEQTQWFTAIDAEIREKKEPLSINVLPNVISMESISPSGLNEKSDSPALTAMFDSSLNASRNPRVYRKGSLESSIGSVSKDFNSSRESGAGVVAAEWHGTDIAADFVSSDIRRAQHRGKNRAFPVQNIAVTRTPLDMGLVDHIRLVPSPELFKDDSVLATDKRLRSNSSSSRRGSADDIAILGGKGVGFRRGSADDIVVPSLMIRQRLTPPVSKPNQARSDWLVVGDVHNEGQVAVQYEDLQQPIQQTQSLDELSPEPAANETFNVDESLEVVSAEASEQLKSTKEATARLSRALVLIEEMKTRWNALLESELQRLDVHPHSQCFYFFSPFSLVHEVCAAFS